MWHPILDWIMSMWLYGQFLRILQNFRLLQNFRRKSEILKMSEILEFQTFSKFQTFVWNSAEFLKIVQKVTCLSSSPKMRGHILKLPHAVSILFTLVSIWGAPYWHRCYYFLLFLSPLNSFLFVITQIAITNGEPLFAMEL